MYNLSWETEDEDDYHRYRRSRDDYRRMRRRRSRSGDREDEVGRPELQFRSNSKHVHASGPIRFIYGTIEIV